MSVCRVCLAGGDVKLYSAIQSRVREVYEKLCNMKFDSNDGRPRVVCCFCYQRLLRCCALSDMAHRSEKVLNDISLEGLEATHETIEDRNLGLVQHLSASPLQIFEVVKKTPREVSMLPIKDEPVSADVDRIKEEQQVAEPDQSLMCKEEFYTQFQFEDSYEKMETELIAQDPLANVKKSPEKTKHKFECYKCGQQFNEVILLQQHLKDHMKTKPYTCKICDKQFIKSHQLLTHMIHHNRGQKYSCNVCNRQCTTEQTLNNHIKQVHTSEKPLYTCSTCKIQCGNMWNLKKHMEIHQWCK